MNEIIKADVMPCTFRTAANLPFVTRTIMILIIIADNAANIEYNKILKKNISIMGLKKSSTTKALQNINVIITVQAMWHMTLAKERIMSFNVSLLPVQDAWHVLPRKTVKLQGSIRKPGRYSGSPETL